MLNSLLITEDKMITAGLRFYEDRFYYIKLRLKNRSHIIINFKILCQEAAQAFNIFSESIK